MSLKTDYKDAMFQGNRKYQMIQNEDGTVSFEDVTEYTQEGDSFGAKDINDTNTEVEKKFDSSDVVDPMVTTQAGFAADAKATGDALKSQNSKIWPVGSIYLSVNATNPGTLFGGTWEQIQGRFLLTAGSGYSAGATGGAASVTSGGSSAANTGGTAITVNQMPSHNHGAIVRDEGSGNYFQIDGSRQRNGSIYAYTTYTGGGQAHNHTMAHTHQVNTMPPYLVVYAWKRTA